MPSAARPVLRAVLIGIALVPALAIAGYLAINLAGMAAAHGTRDRVADAVTERLAAEVPTAKSRSEELARRVDREPDHRWVSQACQFETIDAGWMVQSYREVCAAEAVVAWPVESQREAETLVADARPADRSPYRYGSCLSFGIDGDVYGAHQQLLYVAPGGDRAARWCVPDEEGHPARRAVEGQMAALDPDRAWLLAVTSQPLVDEEIGCVHWSVIFCDNPFGEELAWGDPRG
jgi:hypothetical protein